MKAACILFDLDGTVLNTNDLVMESLKFTIKTNLGTAVEDRSLYQYFGRPLVDIMADLDPVHADSLIASYREYNLLNHDNLTRLFPKVPETLKELKKSGIVTGVVTSKIKKLAVHGLTLFDIDDMFDICIAYEDTGRHKPEPDPVLKALGDLGLEPDKESVIMVGDSPYDILCANSAGVTSAAVQWSVHPREVLAAATPDIWLKDFPALLGYL